MKKNILILFLSLLMGCNQDTDKTIVFIKKQSKQHIGKQTIILVLSSDCIACTEKLKELNRQNQLFSKNIFWISTTNKNALIEKCKSLKIPLVNYNFIEDEGINNQLNSGMIVEYPSMYKLVQNNLMKINNL